MSNSALLKALSDNSYRLLSEEEISSGFDILKVEIEKYLDFPDISMVYFDRENPSLNASIYRKIQEDISNTPNRPYFLFLHTKKISLDKDDLKPNIYICMTHPRHSGKFLPIIKYHLFKKTLNGNDKIEEKIISDDGRKIIEVIHCS